MFYREFKKNQLSLCQVQRGDSESGFRLFLAWAIPELTVETCKKRFFRNNDRFFCQIKKISCHFFKLNARIQNLVSKYF